jgi:hypothetical protein
LICRESTARVRKSLLPTCQAYTNLTNSSAIME